MAQTANPYLSRGPVRAPEMFFGRLGIMREMADFLKGNQSISIVGPRKIGKTSLLFHLMRPPVAQSLGLWDQRLFCYLDGEGLGNDSPAVVLQQFALELRSELESRGAPPERALDAACETPSRLAFEGAVRALGRKGHSIVILLDEFERLSANTHLDINFFNALRSMASRFPLAFITASAVPLIELTFSGRSQEILSSPFFNIFAPLSLGSLAEDEARALIWVPAEQAGHAFPPLLQDALYRYAGRHPFLLQVACFHAFDSDAPADECMVRASQELQSHFEYCWRNLGEDQRKLLREATARPPAVPYSGNSLSILRTLEQRCLIEQKENGWGCPSGGWREFLESQPPEDATATAAPPLRTAPPRYPGRVLGAYEILEPIGKGGMAEVYKARHTRLGRPAAIKILFPHLAAEGDFRERFEREARALAALQHPHIIQVFDYGDADGLYYIAMEYIAGRDLGYRLSQANRLPLAHAWWIAVDIAAALDFAHAQGIVHRDVKPSNILLDPRPHGERSADRPKAHTQRAILTDFGIVKLLDESAQATRAGIYGTADYISPEQIRGDAAVDGRADLYALGVMLFQMLTGKLPFTKGLPNQVLMAHLETPAPDARVYAPDLPEKVSLALQRAMAKDPDERFSTAGEFLAAMK
jgi:tRNA A-37 threonylcarbamoyl transferase component Bud32